MGYTVSGVGVVDKSVALLEAVAAGPGPRSLGQLVEATGISRATAHRLAVALVDHGLLRREGDAFALGLRLVGLGRSAAEGWPLADAARPVLEALREETGESVQLYVRDGQHRICVVSLESPHELRTIVPEGARLALGVGSAGRILAGEHDGAPWTASVEERAPGVASVSAPVHDADGRVVAAVGVSGPIDRTTRTPGARYGDAVARAGEAIEHRATTPSP